MAVSGSFLPLKLALYSQRDEGSWEGLEERTPLNQEPVEGSPQSPKSQGSKT